RAALRVHRADIGGVDLLAGLVRVRRRIAAGLPVRRGALAAVLLRGFFDRGLVRLLRLLRIVAGLLLVRARRVRLAGLVGLAGRLGVGRRIRLLGRAAFTAREATATARRATARGRCGRSRGDRTRRVR